MKRLLKVKNTKMMVSYKNRLSWIDIAKGLAIICTIIGHTVAFGSEIRNIIFSFHMPLFFLLSGYTIKSIQLDGLGQATKKDFVRLIVPVFIMRGVNLIAMTVVNKEPFVFALWKNIRPILWGNGNDYGPIPFSTPLQMYGVGVLWFLIALFWAKLLYRLFDYKIKKFRFTILLFFAFIGIIVGGTLRFPQCMDMIPLILLFMECGRYLRVNIDMDSAVWKQIGILSFFLWIYLAWDKGIYIEMATRQYPYSMLSVLIAILGCIVLIQLSQGLEQFWINGFLMFLGRNTLDLLCIHHIDVYFAFVWGIVLFEIDSPLYFMNEIISAIIRVSLDIMLLVVWVKIKEKIKNRFLTINTKHYKI